MTDTGFSSGRFGIGVDLGGTNLRVAAFNSNMDMLEASVFARGSVTVRKQ